MNWLQAFSIVRQALTIGGTLLTANGLASSQTINGVTGANSPGEAIIGGAGLLASIGWGLYQHYAPVVQANAAKLSNAGK